MELQVYTSERVFSLEGRDRTGPRHSWTQGGGMKGGGGCSGAGSGPVMMAAVHLMSVQAKKEKAKQTRDM